MNRKKTIIATFFLAMLFVSNVKAQTLKNLDISYHIGFNIGATAPVPLPAEVRKVNGFNPKINPQVGVSVKYKLNKDFGLGTGIALDWKGLRIKDEVKYMYTSVKLTKDSDPLTGYFVGDNMTNINVSYVNVPIYAYLNVKDSWYIKLGGYFSKSISESFTGTVKNGYLRIGSPTGEKQEIDEKGAEFDFSSDIRDYDFGLLTGCEYMLNKYFGFYVNFTWGLMPFFYSKTNPIEFNLYNIYGTLGISFKL